LDRFRTWRGLAADHDRAVRLSAAEAMGRAWAEGWAMTPKEAVRYATREPGPDRTRIEP
jgi:hypothetical protein